MRKVFNRRNKPGSRSQSPWRSSSSDSSSTKALPEAAAGPYWVGVASDCNSRYRKSMEDSHTWRLKYMDEPDSGFFAVFDGHAGAQAATYCCKVIPYTLAQELREKEATAPQALFKTFKSIDKQLEDQNIKNSGSTAAVALVRTEGDGRGRRLYVANVGDTRVVLNRGGKALRLSYDHRGGDANEGKRIYNAGGLLMNGRVNGVLAVTRALGDLYMKEYVVGDPYTTETALGPYDEQLIIACDGLWDVCSDQKAVDLIKKLSSPEEASKRLLQYALDNFSTDNLTVMVINLAEN
ncbi:Protein phosphatase 2C 1 [Wickerhamiella sorbophila]|uniref:Protein phosphatase 2C 1 n=1 Tax=Wickerhamiella sorbophila TaxID=45607 RepID=A0A2T0FFW5_9ASCO|nr:Protein phosphatase 2C 1 [Wickerhamiella sorbophila]PRT53857.1 Protein phosphatase 2C 1 [Wickerhamiella sorbophila]